MKAIFTRSSQTYKREAVVYNRLLQGSIVITTLMLLFSIASSSVYAQTIVQSSEKRLVSQSTIDVTFTIEVTVTPNVANVGDQIHCSVTYSASYDRFEPNVQQRSLDNRFYQASTDSSDEMQADEQDQVIDNIPDESLQIPPDACSAPSMPDMISSDESLYELEYQDSPVHEVEQIDDNDVDAEDIPRETVEFRWDVDSDGVFEFDWSSETTIDITYDQSGEYSLLVQARDSQGSTASDQAVITITEESADNQVPIAVFSSDAYGYVNQKIIFDGSDSYDPDGDELTFSWDFGDGVSQEGQTIDHLYSYPGSYSVTLTVTDAHGVSDTTTEDIVIEPNTPPIAQFEIDKEFCFTDQYFYFTDHSYDPDELDGDSITSFTWEFGDGLKADIQHPSHAYEEPGVYEITLKIKDSRGGSSKTTDVVIVGDRNEPPIAHAGGPYTGLVNQPLMLNASLSYDPDGSIVNYSWDFGDLTKGNGMVTPHTYTQPGVYVLTLTVIDNDNGIAANITIVKISAPVDTHRKPELAYAFPDSENLAYCSLTISLPDWTDSPLCYSIDYGDGSTITTPLLAASRVTASHMYTQGGSFTITVSARDSNGENIGEESSITVEIPTNEQTQQEFSEQSASVGLALPVEPPVFIVVITCILISLGAFLFFMYKRKPSYDFEPPMDL